MVLDILARHPSTAKSIATKLVRYFVSDNPPVGISRSRRGNIHKEQW